MAITAIQLKERHCQACEGGLPPLSAEQVREYLKALPGWHLSDDGRRIHRDWRMQDFEAGMKFFRLVADLAESEDHHPDLHLVSYRNVSIEIWTHALGGLSENDFILAAKIDALPVDLKK